MESNTRATRDAPTRPFYLPAVPNLSGGSLERLVTRFHGRHRQFVRRME